MDYTKKKAGQIILEHDQQRLDLEDDIIEYRRQMEPSIMEKLRDTANKAKDTDMYRNSDFYVVLIVMTDRVLRQPRTIIFARKSCPTPVYKQSVWKFRTGTEDLEYLWTIPDAILYYHILRWPSKYINDKETQQLAQFVLLMESGDLLDWVKKENGEKVDAIINITKQENVCLMN